MQRLLPLFARVAAFTLLAASAAHAGPARPLRIVVSGGTPGQYAALIRAEHDANARVAREAGIRVD